MSPTEEAYLEFRRRRAEVIAWLRGEIPGLPDHPAPPDPETMVIREDLILLNELRFLTTVSQPGQSGEPLQRAFVTGFMEADVWDAVYAEIVGLSTVVAFARPADLPDHLPQSHPYQPFLAVTLDEGEPFSSLGLLSTYQPPQDAEALELYEVQVFDPRWGVPRELFQTLVTALREVGAEEDL